MRKIIYAIAFIMFFITTSIFAQNSDLKYYSSIQDGDYNNNFSGYATALFIADSEDVDEQRIEDGKRKIIEVLPESQIAKLTKNNVWLYKKALNEWDYKKGEWYLVMLTNNLYSDEVIFLIVKIQSKDDFDWWGITLTERNMDVLKQIFEEIN